MTRRPWRESFGGRTDARTLQAANTERQGVPISNGQIASLFLPAPVSLPRLFGCAGCEHSSFSPHQVCALLLETRLTPASESTRLEAAHATVSYRIGAHTMELTRKFFSGRTKPLKASHDFHKDSAAILHDDKNMEQVTAAA